MPDFTSDNQWNFDLPGFTAMNTVTQIDLTTENAGSGNSLLSVTMQVSITCGVAMVAALLSGFNTGSGGSETSIPVSIFAYTFICAGLFNAVTAVILPWFRGNPEKTKGIA
jgi:hypothetical protein